MFDTLISTLQYNFCSHSESTHWEEKLAVEKTQPNTREN